MIFSSKRNSLVWIVCAVALVSALAGCGMSKEADLTGISITPSDPNLKLNQTMQLVATGHFNDGSTGSVSNVSWTSADSSHVTVSSTGLIKGVANTPTFSVTITATSGTTNGTTQVMVGPSEVRVVVTCTSCSGNSISLSASGGAGAPVTFTATQGDIDITSSALWLSSDKTIITDPSAGSGTLGGATGTVTITANAQPAIAGGGILGTIQITVTK